MNRPSRALRLSQLEAARSLGLDLFDAFDCLPFVERRCPVEDEEDSEPEPSTDCRCHRHCQKFMCVNHGRLHVHWNEIECPQHGRPAPEGEW